MGHKKYHITLGDRTNWPNPTDPMELEHKLRYEVGELTRYEKLVLASYLHAYKAVMLTPSQGKKPAMIRRELKRISKELNK